MYKNNTLLTNEEAVTIIAFLAGVIAQLTEANNESLLEDGTFIVLEDLLEVVGCFNDLHGKITQDDEGNAAYNITAGMARDAIIEAYATEYREVIMEQFAEYNEELAGNLWKIEVFGTRGEIRTA